MNDSPPSCLFCQIADGKQPAARVLETDAVTAFLDHRPLFPGHCLVIPREHVETLLDLPGALTAPLFDVAAAVARALETALGADGSFVAINNRVSQSVPHLHVHVVPRRRGDGLRGFFWPRGRYADPAAMEEVRARIAGALAAA
ncbi:MAG TPA: HIT family protein [Methylomirabilota bacterium]|nr:HIT family protein [Methylomirabilota bacterium]